MALIIFILDARREDFVLAMLAPGLCQSLKLSIGRQGTEADLFARGKNFLLAEEELDRLHLLKVQGEHALAADLHQFIIRDLQIDRTNLRPGAAGHLGDRNRNTLSAVEIGPGNDIPTLNQAVTEEITGDPFGIINRNITGEEILYRGIDSLFCGKITAGLILDCLAGRPADVIGDTRPIANLNQYVEIVSKWPVDGIILNDRITERSGSGRGNFLFRELRINGINIESTNSLQFNTKVLMNLTTNPLTTSIAYIIFETDYYSPGHENSLQLIFLLTTGRKSKTNKFKTFQRKGAKVYRKPQSG